MILLNFGHPLTEAQFDRLAVLLGKQVDVVKKVPCQLDAEQPFAEQAQELVERAGLSETEWQTVPLLLNLPSLSVAAGAVLAAIHGVHWRGDCLRSSR